MKYYPAFLNLKGKKAVVAGGGKVAERKILVLLQAEALVTVISPSLTSRLKKEKESGRIHHIPRTYRRGDLKGCFLAIAATDSPEVNTLIAQQAPALVNVVDVPKDCNFIVPSVIKRGPLTIAVSTGGVSPALSRTIRKELERMYGREFAAYLMCLKKIRSSALERISDRETRQRFLKSVASGDILKALRSSGIDHVRKTLRKKTASSLQQPL